MLRKERSKKIITKTRNVLKANAAKIESMKKPRVLRFDIGSPVQYTAKSVRYVTLPYTGQMYQLLFSLFVFSYFRVFVISFCNS